MVSFRRRSSVHRTTATRILIAAAIVATTASVGVVQAPNGAFAASYDPGDYPTWAQVQAAQGNAAATQTEIATLNTALASLQQTAAATADAAVKANAANSLAQQNLAAATSQADALSNQVTAEQKKADEAHRQAGQLIAHLYRTGSSSGLDAQLVSGKNPSGTLYKLGALSQLGSQWQTVLDKATVASKSVASLRDQAKVAAAERDRLAGVATTALAAAKSAQAAADSSVTTATGQQQTMYAQLASLNNTTAALEQQYAQGQAAAKAYQASVAQAAADARAAAAKASKPTTVASGTGGTTSTSSGSSSSSSGLGVGVTNDTAGAHAYAQGQMSAHGWSSADYTCLVSLWNQESGWRTNALNVSSQAYGIPQALPADKMASFGLDWETNYVTQINWGLAYIAGRYTTPCGAWAHEVANNWY